MSELSPSYAKELEKQRLRKEALRGTLGQDLAAFESIVFEAGCGHGHWLTGYAMANPREVCVGVDLVSDRIRRACAKRDKRELRNLFFYKAELTEFLGLLPETIRFSRVVFLFPDPWPKKRHHRRRMIQSELLSELATRCDTGAGFFFRTDDRPYFEWTTGLLEAHPEWRIDPEIAWPYEEPTFFQNLMETYQSVAARRV